LICFVEHQGSDLASGHYICYRKVGGEWFKLDDYRVTENPDDLAAAAARSYIYLYSK
jgi:ubiquitin C-terminal hydrolase